MQLIAHLALPSLAHRLLGHVVVLGVVQAPPPLQTDSEVTSPPEHVASAQTVPLSGKLQALPFVPSHCPLQGAVPAQGARAGSGSPVMTLHWPTAPLCLHDSHCPSQAASQQTPSAQWLLAHCSSAAHAEPLGKTVPPPPPELLPADPPLSEPPPPPVPPEGDAPASLSIQRVPADPASVSPPPPDSVPPSWLPPPASGWPPVYVAPPTGPRTPPVPLCPLPAPGLALPPPAAACCAPSPPEEPPVCAPLAPALPASPSNVRDLPEQPNTKTNRPASAHDTTEARRG